MRSVGVISVRDSGVKVMQDDFTSISTRKARVAERDVRRIPVSCAASSGEPTGAVAAERTRERPRSAEAAGGTPTGGGGTVHHSAGPETETSLASS